MCLRFGQELGSLSFSLLHPAEYTRLSIPPASVDVEMMSVELPRASPPRLSYGRCLTLSSELGNKVLI